MSGMLQECRQPREGREWEKQQSSAWHMEAVPGLTPHDLHTNDTEKEQEQISEIRLTASRGLLHQKEAENRGEEKRKGL